jgi:hypothetical protein
MQQRPEHSENPAASAIPDLAPLVAELFAEASPPQRMRLLNGLLRPVGPLALVAVAAGAFASLLPAARWRSAQATLDDAMHFSAGQVLELARYVEQKSPESLAQLPSLLAGSPLWASSLSGALLLLALQAWSKRTSAIAARPRDQSSSKSPL